MKFLIAAAVVCVVMSMANAKALDARERMIRTLMEDEEFKRGITDTVCNALESVLSNYGADILNAGCSTGLSKDFLCDKVVSFIGGWFSTPAKLACGVLLDQSFVANALKSLENQCHSGATSLGNIDIC